MVVRAQFAKPLVQQYRKISSEQRCEAGQHHRFPPEPLPTNKELIHVLLLQRIQWEKQEDLTKYNVE